MIHLEPFVYHPDDEECEKASNSYVMSLVAAMIGMPLPIVNLIATFAFYLAQKNSTFFVRWHCTQALLSQFSLLIINATGFIWTTNIIFGDQNITNIYIGYLITMVLYNLGELIATIYTSIQVRKGIHVSWMFYGPLTDQICAE